ncbi:MAG: DUF4173 domain-containing protein [Firmicutes bacterium]|nr:DUF4173 domain-containing protein [Bacillota bacterium]
MDEQPKYDWPAQNRVAYPAGKAELRLCAAILLAAIMLADCMLYGGFALGFGVCAGLIPLLSWLYLLRKGGRPTLYSAVLLGLTLLTALSFARSDDGFVKFVSFCFLTVGANLCLCLTAGQSRFAPGRLGSLLDVPVTIFGKGFGCLDRAARGLRDRSRQFTGKGLRRLSVLAGLVLAVPLVAVIVALLVRADAAFEGLLTKMPQFSPVEPIAAVLLGLILGIVLYTRATALAHEEKPRPAEPKTHTGNPVMAATLLAVICLIYALYLLSQLAYVFGGFLRLLPENYTLAEYARRGFFEMTALSAINLGLIALSTAFTSRESNRPVRLMCLFIAVVTLLFVGSASAKMLLYIRGFGMSRLRVLTEVIIVFFGIATVCVSIWILAPKFPYMKALVVSGMLLCALTAWVDVDTVVARYNVEAHQSGALSEVDVAYLASLSAGAIPALGELTADSDWLVAEQAKQALADYSLPSRSEWDLRGWTSTYAAAREILEQYQ